MASPHPRTQGTQETQGCGRPSICGGRKSEGHLLPRSSHVLGIWGKVVSKENPKANSQLRPWWVVKSNSIAMCLSLKYCNMWKLHVYWCFLLNSTLLLVMFFPNVDRWCCFLGGPVPQHGAFNRCSHLWDITFFLHTMAAKQKHNLHQQLTTPPFTNI